MMELNQVIGYIIYLLISTNVFIIYTTIFSFMILESSFIPFPSEIVMIPAGILAGMGKVNVIIVIILGVIGSVIGALINYYIGKKIGDKLLTSKKKWLFIKPKHLAKSKKYFEKYGNETILFSRLIPVVRQYISIPAGAANMKLSNFVTYTAIGSAIWVSFLTFIGYIYGEFFNSQILNTYNIIILAIVASGLVFIIYKELSKWI